MTTKELFEAAKSGRLMGITARQLADAGALHIAARRGHLAQIAGGVTARDLAGAVDPNDGTTALHIAAAHGHLGQVTGGVTAQQLAGVRDKYGRTALRDAAANGHLGQVAGGVTAEQLEALAQ